MTAPHPSNDPQMTFLVRRDDLAQCRTVMAPPPRADALADGEILCQVDQFAFTANNVTYAIAGDTIGYWTFFPAPAPYDPAEWGIVPVWGYATVTASKAADVAPGERLYGYFPMGTHLVMRPGAAGPRALVDKAAHRASLPAVYNQYLRISEDAGQAAEDAQMLYRPLFMTSFLIADFLEEETYFGADSVLIVSASSKTAIGIAQILAREAHRPRIVGLTSPGNVDFVRSLGCYDDVVPYDRVPADCPAGKIMYVDMAGNAELLTALHHHYRDDLTYSCMVGATHGAVVPLRGVPGAPPVFFFAPDRIAKRHNDWGPGGVDARFAPAWESFVADSAQWISVMHANGPASVERLWQAMRSGHADPARGHILSLWPKAE